MAAAAHTVVSDGLTRPAMKKAQISLPFLRLLDLVFVFLGVQVFAQKAISPLTFAVKGYRTHSLVRICWFFSEEQSWLFVPFMDSHMRFDK